MPPDGACRSPLALPRPLNGALQDTVQGQLYGPLRRGPPSTSQSPSVPVLPPANCHLPVKAPSGSLAAALPASPSPAQIRVYVPVRRNCFVCTHAFLSLEDYLVLAFFFGCIGASATVPCLLSPAKLQLAQPRLLQHAHLHHLYHRSKQTVDGIIGDTAAVNALDYPSRYQSLGLSP